MKDVLRTVTKKAALGKSHAAQFHPQFEHGTPEPLRDMVLGGTVSTKDDLHTQVLCCSSCLRH